MEFSQTYGLHRMIEHNIINYWKVNLANSNDSNLIDDEDELFCGIVSRRKPFSLISNRGHCQRSSPSRISYTPWAGFEPAQNLSSGFVELTCAVAITTIPWCQNTLFLTIIGHFGPNFTLTLVQNGKFWSIATILQTCYFV